jgi:parallel beta-helix repeat protein
MTKHSKLFLVCVLGVVLSTSLALAQDKAKYTEGTGKFIEVMYEFPAPQVTESGDYHSVSIGDLHGFGKPGFPILPYKTAKILVPFDTEVTKVRISCAKKVTLPGSYVIEPGQQPVPLSFDGPVQPTLPDEQVYGSASPFPERTYGKWSLACKQGYKMVMLNLYPVEYLPLPGRISYYPSITARVYTSGVASMSGSSEFLPRRRNPSAQEIERIKRLVDNPALVDSYSTGEDSVAPLDKDSVTPLGEGAGLLLDPEDYEYVIITNEALANAGGAYTFQDLVDHKIPRGTTATIVTTEWIYTNYDGTRPDGGADNQTRIRNFIIDAYNTWGTTYVLLGGDGDGADVGGESGNEIIPARGFTGNGLESETFIPADMYYACLDGSFDYDGDGVYGEPTDGPTGGEVDLFAEVYVGRAPVDSEDEVSNFVEKTIAYENTFSQDPSLKKALMLGENLGWSVSGCDYKDEVRDGSSNYGYTTVGFPGDWDVTSLCDRDDPWNENDLIPLLNSGTHLVNHDGHASVGRVMKLVNLDVDGLTNDQYFLAYSQGCYCGSFDNRNSSGNYTSYDSIAEHFVTESSGAFAVIMNSRYGWGNYFSTDGPSQRFDREFFDAYFGEEIVNLGVINQDSKEDNAGYVNSNPYGRWCCYQITLFGDPQTPIGGVSGPAGVVVLDKSVYPSTGVVNILVADTDLNTDSEVAEQYSDLVTVVTTGGDLESNIVMTETGVSTGVFVGTIAVEDADVNPINPEDGILQINCQVSDTITATYHDADDGSGQPATPTDTAMVDCIPPDVSNIDTPDILAGAATITWDTDEPAYSCVFYGTDPDMPLELSECNPSLETSHTITLTGLSPETTYYFKVVSTDEAANQTIDDNDGAYYQFTTPAWGTYYVPGDFASIQAAINSLSSYNEIIVSPGTYYENIDFLGKRLNVRSVGGAEVTIIDAFSVSVVTFNSGEGSDSILDGFTITNTYGHGVYCDDNSSPKIINCIITGKLWGIYTRDGSAPSFTDCIISNNDTGAYCEENSFPTFTNCTITNNNSGVDCHHATPTFINCTITNNDVGGGVYLRSSTPTFNNCNITDNSASRGGGINSFFESSSIFTNCIISGNTATEYRGGGIYLGNNALTTFTNCIIADNTAGDAGGGISFYSDAAATITNCTISGNTAGSNGGGIHVSTYSDATVVNSILYNNTAAGTPNQIYLDGGSIDITYSDIEGSWTGAGNIDADPLFVSVPQDDYRLLAGSPCIDAANSDPPAPTTDREGNLRFDDPGTPNVGTGVNGDYYDMGAYENQYVSYSISGRITDESQNGVDGATVELSGGINDSSVTSGGGYYSFPVFDGDNTVTPSQEGYEFAPHNREVTVSGADVPGQDFTATWSGEMVIDNPAATFEDPWSTYSGSAPIYGTAWWIEGGSRATNAPYTIYYSGGSETVRVNQKQPESGGQWNYLGTYPFAIGTSGYVVLADGPDADGVVCADAIMLEPKTVVDNPDAAFAGTWSTYSGSAPTYGTDCRYKSEGTGSGKATWTPDVPTAGTYDVYAWWITGDSRATNAPYTINYDGGSETVRVNQKATTGQWNYLGTYPFAAGTSGSMVLSDGPDADGVVCADAIMLEPKTGDLVDNPDAAFAGTWSTLVGHADGYGADLRYKAGGDGSGKATWIPDVPTDRTYDVYAWWITGSSRATNAPYTINYDGGSETVRVNQKATTGQWNYLGTYPFAADTSGSVVLSDGPDADGVVCADAIMLEPKTGDLLVDNGMQMDTGLIFGTRPEAMEALQPPGYLMYLRLEPMMFTPFGLRAVQEPPMRHIRSIMMAALRRLG